MSEDLRKSAQQLWQALAYGRGPILPPNPFLSDALCYNCFHSGRRHYLATDIELLRSLGFRVGNNYNHPYEIDIVDPGCSALDDQPGEGCPCKAHKPLPDPPP